MLSANLSSYKNRDKQGRSRSADEEQLYLLSDRPINHGSVIFIYEVRIGQTAPLEQKNLALSFFRAVYLQSFLGAFGNSRINA